jgi:hypothetical protein
MVFAVRVETEEKLGEEFELLTSIREDETAWLSLEYW